MKDIYVMLDTIEKVKEFCNITSSISCNVYLQRDCYVVDAKSIMGIFSLDLSKVCHFLSDDVISEDIYNKLKKFEV